MTKEGVGGSVCVTREYGGMRNWIYSHRELWGGGLIVGSDGRWGVGCRCTSLG